MAGIQRRGFLALSGLVALGLSACGRGTPAETSAPVFVLVHGALHGGWCWRRVARQLRAAGAEVFTPTLTGLGERVHLNGPHIDLATHIQDVVNVIEYEELERVVLVGHSYAGMIITGAVQSLEPKKIANLVYLDAVIPRDGETTLDAMGGLVINPEPEMFSAQPGTDFGVTDENDRAWVRRRVTSQSAQTLRDKLAISRDMSAFKRTFIACTADNDTGSPTDDMRRTSLARLDKSWRREEIATGHDAMITAPRAVSDLLLQIAAA
jgi:pimeloyl-ACP methyl ester carboxylesterase